VTDLTDDPQAMLLPYVQNARWFGGKGRAARMRVVRRLGVLTPTPTGTLPERGPGVAIDLVEVSYDGPDVDYYQLPLAFYAEPQEQLTHALVGAWDDESFGKAVVYDAVHDRDAMACWLDRFAAAEPGAAAAPAPAGGDRPADERLRFRRLPGHDLDTEAHSTLFSGEQSNSSVAFGEDSLMKVFRRVTPGRNPDITVHEVLTRAGSDHVAALYGWLETDGAAEWGGEVLHLAMLQQFLRTATDGWDLALNSVRNLFAEADLHADEVGGDFASESARLGTALAEVHDTLRDSFPTAEWRGERVGTLAADMHRRLDDALTAVPDLAPYEGPLRSTFDAVRSVGSVQAQQVHGDLHLGQTLRTVKGWKLVDFEGEPARPLAERTEPDSRWRDVAGMLRSFDYAPRVVALTLDDDGDGEAAAAQREFRATEWSSRNRSAFLDAYAPDGLDHEEGALLAAYLADKAVYEAVYEARNRPSWLHIPLTAIERIGTA
jgi:maltokinase